MTCWRFRRQKPAPKWARDLLQLQRVLAVRQERLVMALVQIDQVDLDNFAAAVEAQVAALGAAASELSAYIAKLVAGQAVPLAAADENAINKAVADLTNAAAAVTALEPPAPAAGA